MCFQVRWSMGGWVGGCGAWYVAVVVAGVCVWMGWDGVGGWGGVLVALIFCALEVALPWRQAGAARSVAGEQVHPALPGARRTLDAGPLHACTVPCCCLPTAPARPPAPPTRPPAARRATLPTSTCGWPLFWWPAPSRGTPPLSSTCSEAACASMAILAASTLAAAQPGGWCSVLPAAWASQGPVCKQAPPLGLLAGRQYPWVGW